MSAPTMMLLALAAVAAGGLLVGDWRRRTGRGAPLSRVRTAIRRRTGTGTDGEALLAAGFAAQVIGPLLARATRSTRRADGARARLERRVADEHNERGELAGLVDRLGEDYDGVRPTNPRWHRYVFYAVVIVIDVLTGLVIANGLNLGEREGVGFGASAGLFLFFAGKIGGTGLRRLDLARPEPTTGPSHPDIGKTWVSGVLIALSVAGIITFIAGMTASRQLAQTITTTANTAAGTTAIALPPMPWWQSALSSAVALGSFAATVFMAMRSHPITRRIEELEHRITRHAHRTHTATKPLSTALETAGRDLALLDAALAELTARLNNKTPLTQHPAFTTITTNTTNLHHRHTTALTTLDTTTNPTTATFDGDAGADNDHSGGDTQTIDITTRAAELASSNGSHR